MSSKRDVILEPLEGRTIQVTALSIDIVNSSEQVKMLSEKQIGEYYKKFIETSSDLIEKHGGYVLKNAGDCVIGFFLSGEPMVENFEKAVFCGLAMIDLLKNSLNPYLTERKIPEIECRISADFGPVQVLRIRSRDGSSAMDLFGTPINMATKMSHYAKAGQVVIGDNLFWRLIDSDGIDFKLLKRWDIRGKYTYPVYLVEKG